MVPFIAHRNVAITFDDDPGEENLVRHREVLTLESMDNIYNRNIKKRAFLCVFFVL